MNSFSDARVFPQQAKFPYLSDRVTVSQDFDGATYLHVGMKASNSACASLAERYGLDLEVLLKIRDGN